MNGSEREFPSKWEDLLNEEKAKRAKAEEQKRHDELNRLIEQAHRQQPKVATGEPTGAIRQFGTGATRNSDAGRYDPEGFLSPIVIERFCEYMNKNRVQADGSIRASDNWQKGIPKDTYMKGMWRHFLHLWTRFRGFPVQDKMAAADIEEDCCAIMFASMGLLFEVLKERYGSEQVKQRNS